MLVGRTPRSHFGSPRPLVFLIIVKGGDNMEFLRTLWRDTSGQSMAEYGLLTALIALACVAGVKLLGQTLAGKISELEQQIGG
jgi:Flp pilus assembly pilin Flp